MDGVRLCSQHKVLHPYITVQQTLPQLLEMRVDGLQRTLTLLLCPAPHSAMTRRIGIQHREHYYPPCLILIPLPYTLDRMHIVGHMTCPPTPPHSLTLLLQLPNVQQQLPLLRLWVEDVLLIAQGTASYPLRIAVHHILYKVLLHKHSPLITETHYPYPHLLFKGAPLQHTLHTIQHSVEDPMLQHRLTQLNRKHYLHTVKHPLCRHNTLYPVIHHIPPIALLPLLPLKLTPHPTYITHRCPPRPLELKQRTHVALAPHAPQRLSHIHHQNRL